MKPTLVIFAALALASAAVAYADSSNNSKVSRDPASTRSKNIKFEDDVVEGMNKNPMDSAENLGRRDGNAQGRLYHKPLDFKDAVRQTVHEMGKTQ